MKVLREGPARITKATVDAAWKRRAKGQRIVIGDAACPGLALIVNPAGMAWRFDYRPRGKDTETGKRFPMQSVTIGNPESHSPDEARAAANAMKGQAKAGTDLAQQRRAKIAADAKRRSQTLDRLAEDYAKALPRLPMLRGKGLRTADYTAREIGRVKAAIGNMKAGDKHPAELTAADIRALLRVTAAEPGAARHRFGALNRFLDWCRDEGMLAANPCATIGKDRRPKPVPARKVHMKPDGLAELWKAAGEAEKLHEVQRDFARFLIAVPCRRNEAAEMDWSHLDLAAAEWRQPDALTKNGDPHRFHLHPLALALLRGRWEAANKPKAGLVFPAPRSIVKPKEGDEPTPPRVAKALTTFSALKREMAKKADSTGWRFHDCRRSFVTALAEKGFAESVLDAILNHRQAATRSGVLGVYQQAVRWPEQVRAMEVWGDLLAAAIEGRETAGNIVQLRPAATA